MDSKVIITMGRWACWLLADDDDDDDNDYDDDDDNDKMLIADKGD